MKLCNSLNQRDYFEQNKKHLLFFQVLRKHSCILFTLLWLKLNAKVFQRFIFLGFFPELLLNRVQQNFVIHNFNRSHLNNLKSYISYSFQRRRVNAVLGELDLVFCPEVHCKIVVRGDQLETGWYIFLWGMCCLTLDAVEPGEVLFDEFGGDLKVAFFGVLLVQ